MNIRKTTYPMWFIAPAMTFYLLFYILPNLFNIGLGFTDWNINFLDDIKFNGLKNYKIIFSTSFFKGALLNTLYFTAVTAVVINILGFFLALIVDSGLKLENYYRTVFFTPFIISPMVVGVIFSAIYNPQNGLLNTFLRGIGLGSLASQWLVEPKLALSSICAMDIWMRTGFHMVLFLSGLQTIPKEAKEAAIIAGASGFQTIRYVTFPLIAPALTVSVLIGFIHGLKVFQQVFVLTGGGPLDKTQVIATFIFKNFSNGMLGLAAASEFMFMLIVTISSIIILKFLRKREIEV